MSYRKFLHYIVVNMVRVQYPGRLSESKNMDAKKVPLSSPDPG